jgi:hypothetical protein
MTGTRPRVSAEALRVPVPRWRPSIAQPIDRIVDRLLYYTDHARDFVIFRHGTCALVPVGLVDEQAIAEGKRLLAEVLAFHPDMTPREMDDGNILVEYRQPVFNVVLEELVTSHWGEIDRHHQDALATSEVILTPLGPNVFDEFGKKALFGRCFMFMDAQLPEAMRVVRAAA